MSTHRSLRLGLLAISTAALAAACGEPFGFVGAGGSGSTSSGTGGAASTSSGGGGSGGTASTSSGMGGMTSTSSGSSSSGGCDDTDPDGDGVTGCDGDCDNDDPDVYLGAPETCGDAKDNDCNKTVDDKCGGFGTYVANPNNGGDDNNPGTMSAPVATIAKGIEHAQTINAMGGDGSRVFVSAGHYPEDVTVVEGISLYGGYAPGTWARDPAANDTAILAQGADGVYCDDTITRQTVIDGFRLQGKDNASTGGSTDWGTALTVDRGTPTISGNVINGPVEGNGQRSIGLVILGPSMDASGPLVTGNQIRGGNAQGTNPCDVSMGVLLASTTFPPPAPGAGAEITSNEIRGGLCKSSYGLVSWANADGTLVADNDISAGTATVNSAFGVSIAGSPLDALIILDKNRINVDQNGGGTCAITAAFGWCGGIDSQSAKARITNNIVFGLKAPRSTAVWLRNPEMAPAELVLNSNYLDGAGNVGSQSVAVVLTLGQGTDGAVGRIRNNILAGGAGASRFGVYEESAMNKQVHPQKLENNDFFLPITGGNAYYRTWDGSNGNKLIDLGQVNQLPDSQANISGDPGLDASFHLTSATSICVDKGTSNEAPPDDIDGEPRPNGKNDIGPDER